MLLLGERRQNRSLINPKMIWKETDDRATDKEQARLLLRTTEKYGLIFLVCLC